MKISRFMSEALFNPTTGYYRTKNPIGKNSDFITAPEISQVFGELLAAYFLQIASAKKSPIAFVEMGAGKGTLFFDILSSIKKLAAKNIPQAVDFLERATFHIVEIGEVLREVQQKNLADFAVLWHENFEDFLSHLSPLPSHSLLSQQNSQLSPRRMTGSISSHELSQNLNSDSAARWTPSFDGATIESVESDREIFFLSNELFDCFAIDQFVLTEIGWRERIVSDKKFTLAPFEKKTHEFVEKTLDVMLSLSKHDSGPRSESCFDKLSMTSRVLAPIGAVFEYSLEAQNFMAQLCAALKKQGGIAINIDYGYIKNEFANTLQALKNHQKCDVLENVGEADLTALVDFGALEKIVKNCGLNSSLISQSQFLTGLGIEERRKNLLEKNSQKSTEINSAIDRLIASDQMGDLFKCLIIW